MRFFALFAAAAMAAMPVRANTDLVSLGTASYTVNSDATTAIYAQNASGLVFSGAYSLGDTLGGTFATQNWSNPLFTGFGLVMSLTGTNPNLAFTVEFFDASFNIINTYEGTTSGVLTSTFVPLTLKPEAAGTGVLTSVAGLQITWDGDGTLDASIAKVVAVAPTPTPSPTPTPTPPPPPPPPPPTPTISGAATATAFTTTYGTPSAAQTFNVSGSGLTANLVATAPTGFEVSSNGTTFGSTAVFTQSGGSASGQLRVRLAATAGANGSYNSQNIVLSSSGAANVNIRTASSGNSVSAKTLTITGLTAASKNWDGTTTASVTGTPTYSGLVNGENFPVTGSVTWSFPDANVGTAKTLNRTGNYNAPSANYAVTQPTLTANIAAVVPGAPTITEITPGDARLTVALNAPTFTGGASITNYEYSTNGGFAWATPNPAVTSSPLIITGLSNGTTYNVQLRAVNSAGSGTASATTQATPEATAPTPTPTPAPTPAPLASVPQMRFNGLLGLGTSEESATDYVAKNGQVSIVVTKGNSFSGSLRLGPDKISFRGVFTSGVYAVAQLVRKSGASPLSISMTALPGNPAKIIGTVTAQGLPNLPFVALPPATTTKKTYTIALSPDNSSSYAGHGFATVTSDTNGKAKVAGMLSDGSKFTATTYISDGAPDGVPSDLIAPVYIPLKGGLLTGELQIDKTEPVQGASVDDGNQAWGWIQNNVNVLALRPKGTSFAVTKGFSFLTGTVASGTFGVTGVEAEAISGSWPASNKPEFGDKNFQLSFSSSAGSIKGSVKDPKISYVGIMFASPIILSDGTEPVRGAGFKSEGANSSQPVLILAP